MCRFLIYAWDGDMNQKGTFVESSNVVCYMTGENPVS